MNEPSNFEWSKFEAAIQFLKQGIDTLLFREVIMAATGYKALPFDKESLAVIDLVDVWIKNDLTTLSETFILPLLDALMSWVIRWKMS